MITNEVYLGVVNRVINKGFINSDELNVDLSQLTPIERAFILSITKQTNASEVILEGIQIHDLCAMGKHLYSDSRILNFATSISGSELYKNNLRFEVITTETLDTDPGSIIGLYTRTFQEIYKKDYKEAVRLIESLRKHLPLNEKINYLLVMSFFYLKDIPSAKSTLTNLRPSLQKYLISYFLYYSESLMYHIISGFLLVICIAIIYLFWIPILLVFLIDILLISLGYFYRNKMIVTLGKVDIISKALFAGLGLLARYLVSTI